VDLLAKLIAGVLEVVIGVGILVVMGIVVIVIEVVIVMEIVEMIMEISNNNNKMVINKLVHIQRLDLMVNKNNTTRIIKNQQQLIQINTKIQHTKKQLLIQRLIHTKEVITPNTHYH